MSIVPHYHYSTPDDHLHLHSDSNNSNTVSASAAAVSSASPDATVMMAVVATIAKSIYCGAFAGACNSTVSFPLDTIKVRAQSQQGKLSYAAVVADGWRSGGIRSFYRGVSLPMLGVMCDNSAIFATNTAVLNVLERFSSPSRSAMHATASSSSSAHHHGATTHSRPLSHTVIAGAMSGVSSGLVLTPFELVKCRIQLWKSMPHNTYSSSNAAAGTTPSRSLNGAPTIGNVVKVIYFKEGGVLGFFQGCRATVVREVPGTLTWLMTYQNIIASYHRHFSTAKRKSDDDAASLSVVVEPPPPLLSMFAGGMAGVAYWTIGYPADFIKTRVQSGALRGTTSSSSQAPDVRVIPAILEVLKTSGIRGLYRGYGITVARAFPSNAILFTAYEYASGTWDRNIAAKFRN